MNQNESKPQLPNNNHQFIQNSHNQSLNQLFNQSNPKLLLNNELKNIEEQLHSTQKLFKISSLNEEQPPIIAQNIQPKSVFVRSGTYNHSLQPQQPFFRSRTMISQKKYQADSTSQFIKHKLPLTILDFIIANAKLKRLPQSTLSKTETGRKLGQMGFSKRLNQKYNKKKCLICETQLPEKQFQKMTKSCDHIYCSSCLHQYVIYKINAFEAVECPKQGCNQPLDQQSPLYQQLPLQVRKKYKKLLQYEMVKEHPNRKMCPQQSCEGWIEINEVLQTTCNLCKKVYCSKCLLPHHDGDCDNKQLQFFQGTLHYRQCNKCKNVIQKSSGCVHMTCRCGYQFCYLCGAKWNHSHTCRNPDQQPLAREDGACCCCCCCCQMQCCGCDCGDCCDNFMDGFGNGCCGCYCDCCDLDNCEGLECILTIIRKVIMFLLWVIFFFPTILLLDFIMLGVAWIGITLLTGATMYTCEFISDLEPCWFVAAIILYPITALVGIAIAFRQLFCEIYVAHIVETCQTVTDLFIQGSCDD